MCLFTKHKLKSLKVNDDCKKVEGWWTDDGGENEVRVVSIVIMMVVRWND